WQADLTPEQAEQHILGIRDKYYERVGMTEKRYSVSDYVENNSDVVESLFHAYYPGLAEAVSTRKNNETMQGLASALLQADLQKMKPEIRAQLIRVANSSYFNDDMCATMESVIRYAVVEELRKGLKDLVTTGKVFTETSPDSASARLPETGFSSALAMMELNQRMANNVQSGVKAGRSYGGCAGQVELNEGGDGLLGGLSGGQSKQEPYGGKSCKSIKHGESTTCPHCKKSVKTIVPVAGGKVYCNNGQCKEAAPQGLLKRFAPKDKRSL
ncbi:MAG TPA: hypothetical protein VMU97_01875, partial [Candidatus Dormibacteraeota bacterium]|nr:hypothetical protein [Candidatus Dormibacteraeota bacterium]